MKKFLIMAIALLAGGALHAQKAGAQQTKKSFLAFHAGPTIPAGDFGSKNTGNEDAGYAKTGFTINLNYGYQFEKNAGVTASAFYNNFNTHKFVMAFNDGSGPQNIELKMDHWQFYGLSAGPMLTFELGKNINTDVKVMGGVANANSPKITYNSIVMAEQDWGWAPVLQGGLNLRIGTGSNLFLFANADYLYMKPKFQYSYTNENDQWVTEDIKQKISAVNVTAGIGFKF